MRGKSPRLLDVREMAGVCDCHEFCARHGSCKQPAIGFVD
jgi:hypothetical protein